VGFLALPLLASAGPQFSSPGWHYGAPLFPFLVWAAAGGVQRLPRRLQALHAPALLITFALISAWILGPPATGRLTTSTVGAEDARAALALIHPGDGVAAGDPLGAHLAGRRELRLAPFPLATVPVTFPLSATALSQTPADVARIDAVVVVQRDGGRGPQVNDAVQGSPWLDEFPYRVRFGDVFVYRRTAP
jgi:hypothetical protein